MSFKSILLGNKDKIAVVTSDNSKYSFGDIANVATAIYKEIGHRSLVFCLCNNSIGSLSGYISFITNKVVPLMLEASLDRELLEKLINTYNPEYLWVPAKLVVTISNKMSEYLKRTRKIKNVAVVRNWQEDYIFNNVTNSTRNELFTYMYVGSISPAAGVDFLIKSFVKAKIDNSKLIIAGDGSQKEFCIDYYLFYLSCNICKFFD